MTTTNIPSANAEPVKESPVPDTTFVHSGAAQAAPQTPKTSGKAVASLVCGIIGILIFGIILGPLAICLGVSAKNDIQARPEQLSGSCQATAGVTCGAVAIVIWIIVVIAVYG